MTNVQNKLPMTKVSIAKIPRGNAAALSFQDTTTGKNLPLTRMMV